MIRYAVRLVDWGRAIFWPNLRRIYPGYCSFCCKSYKDVGHLAEGPDDVFICAGCVKQCGDLIANASKPEKEQNAPV